jgi:hypothetical protein
MKGNQYRAAMNLIMAGPWIIAVTISAGRKMTAAKFTNDVPQKPYFRGIDFRVLSAKLPCGEKCLLPPIHVDKGGPILSLVPRGVGPD